MTTPETRAEAFRRGPVFLARETYRRRRLMDAAGLLPIFAAFLFLVPLLWPRGDEGTTTSVAIFYIFGVWLGMSVLTALVSVRLGGGPADPAGASEEGPLE